MGPTVEASHNAAADLALKALADSGVKIGSQKQKDATEGAGGSSTAEPKNTSGPRTLVSVNAKKKQKAAAAAANAAASAAAATATTAGNGNTTAANSVSNGREVVVDEKAKNDLKS